MKVFSGMVDHITYPPCGSYNSPISGQSNCIDDKMACKACLAWESEGPF